MPTFKGDTATTSYIEEDNGWGQPPSAYTGGKFLQSNDGTLNASRAALESEARTPNAQLAGSRLGNKNVAGSYPVEIDPENYNPLLESLFYGEFKTSGASVTVSSASLTGSLRRLVVPVDDSDETTLVPVVGNSYRLSGIVGTAEQQKMNGVHVLQSFDAGGDAATFIVPDQLEASLSLTSDITITPVQTVRPEKVRKSFNFEEILHAEDGTSKARFMSKGVIVSGASFDIPSDGTLKTTFSMLGSGMIPSAQYSGFDATLTDSQDAHSSPASHVKYQPLVVQDGQIVIGTADTRCAWLSGSIGIENNTEMFFVGCSYDAGGATSGNFRITLSAEVLFESEQDYINFDNEVVSDVVLRLNVRDSEKCLLIYLPAMKFSTYDKQVSTGLVSASVTGLAEVDAETVDSITLASYTA